MKLANLAVVVGTLGAFALTACSGDDAESGALIVWSLENQTERVQAAQAAADRFTQQSGIKVQIVGTDENQFTQLITSAAAAGDMPDVVGALPLAPVWQLAANDLLDTEAAAAVVKELADNTFSARTLELTRKGGTQLAVPSDAYPMLLIYRKDLFEAAGLPTPDTFARIEEAAEKLNKADLAGITMATAPDELFTAQTFEFFALANNCQVVDGSGNVTLDSPACQEAFRLYGNLATRYSVPGAQSVDSTRATYFSGRAAMIVWSSFLLDELASLRNDAKPNCQQCQGDPNFLAANSGIVTTIKGPDGPEPAGYGELTSWIITKGGAKTDAAKKFVSFMMQDGYLDWLGVAPEGKFPARLGTASNPKQFVDGWSGLPSGVDAKRPLPQIYPAPVIDALRGSSDSLRRWGIAQGQGELVGAMQGELALPRALAGLASGQYNAQTCAKQATDAVKSLKASIG